MSVRAPIDNARPKIMSESLECVASGSMAEALQSILQSLEGELRLE